MSIGSITDNLCILFVGMPVDIAIMGMFHLTNLVDRLAIIFNLPLPNPIHLEDTLHSPTISLQADLSIEYCLLPIHVLKKPRSHYRGFEWTPLNGLFQEHTSQATSTTKRLTGRLSATRRGKNGEEDQSLSCYKVIIDSR